MAPLTVINESFVTNNTYQLLDDRFTNAVRVNVDNTVAATCKRSNKHVSTFTRYIVLSNIAWTKTLAERETRKNLHHLENENNVLTLAGILE